MEQAEMTVGPKGQVVIPVEMRRALKIAPGSKVRVTHRDGKVIIENPRESAASVFKRMARSGPPLTDFDPHIAEEELEERLRR